MSEATPVPEGTPGIYPRGRIVLLTVATTLLTLLGAIYDWSREHKAVEEAALRAAGRVALVAESVTDLSRLLLAAMESLVLSDIPDRAVANQLLAWKAKQPLLMDLLVLDAYGMVVHWTGPGEAPDVSDRDYFRAHAGTARPALYFGAAQKSRVREGRRFVSASTALRDEAGALRFVLVAIFDEDQLSRRTAARTVAPIGEGAVFDQAGALVFGGPVAITASIKVLIGNADRSLQPNPAEVTWLRMDNGERPASLRAVPRSPLIAVGTVDPQQMNANWWRHLAWWAVLWIAGTALPVFLLATSGRGRQGDALVFNDPITGLPNRKTIRATAIELAPDVIGKEDFSIVLLDVDDFGAYVRRHGEMEGNRRLRELGAWLARELDEHGVVGRYGNDEFLIVLPRHGAVAAMALAEQWRLALAQVASSDDALSVSIGVASANQLDPAGDSVISRAEEALATARKAGRGSLRYC